MIIRLLLQKLSRLRSVDIVGTSNLWRVLAWAVLLNLAFGGLFYLTEREAQELTLWDALWWSMVTMTTVGYGDFYATTAVGRFLISYPCMLLGIGLVGYLVGYIANLIIDLAAKKRRGEMELREKGHIIVCGYPGEEKILAIVAELRAVERLDGRAVVLVTEQLEELPEKLHKAGMQFVKGLPTDESVLMKADVLDCEGVVILARDPHDASSDDRTFTVSSLLEIIEREHGRPIKTIAEVVAEKNIRTLRRANVDGVTSEDGVAGRLLAQEFVNPGINGVISQLLTNQEGSQLYIVPAETAGLRIRDLQIGALNHDVNIQIIGIIQGDIKELNPSKDTIVGRGDRLIVLADSESDLRALEKELVAGGQPSATREEAACSNRS
jgi:voltage-gated potassium channel